MGSNFGEGAGQGKTKSYLWGLFRRCSWWDWSGRSEFEANGMKGTERKVKRCILGQAYSSKVEESRRVNQGARDYWPTIGSGTTPTCHNAAGHRPQATGHRIQDTGYRIHRPQAETSTTFSCRIFSILSHSHFTFRICLLTLCTRVSVCVCRAVCCVVRCVSCGVCSVYALCTL
jgi:hypothetical protein